MAERKNNGHYSEQPGHKMRGEYARVQRAIEFGGLPPAWIKPFSLIYQPVDMSAGWTRRKHMRRVPRDGRG